MKRRYREPEFVVLGRLIARLTHGLAKIKDWTLKDTMEYIGERSHKSSDMVYRWQQGHVLPKPEVIEVLAEIGCRDADLSREWGEEFLREGHYHDPINLINTLWGPKELRVVRYRLARIEHTNLIGRQEELKQLLGFLSPRYGAHVITVDGIGGVGKTALVLEAAYQCLRASTGELTAAHIPTFEAIIFVSAKQEYLTAQGILPSAYMHRTLRKIFQEVTQALERLDIRATPLQEQADLVREALERQRTLLIIDNLETMEDKQGIFSFLYSLPSSVKVVVTTRERLMFAPIRLEQLEEQAAYQLIDEQARDKQVELNAGEPQMLYQNIGGIPAALVYAIGQRAAGYRLETVLRNIPKAEGEVARFCFHGSVEPLYGTPAHFMLMAFALFPQMPTYAAVSHVAGLGKDLIGAEEALSQLLRLSLVRDIENRFRMLPLTREYALAELGKVPEFEREAHQRWIEYYMHFTKEYGGHDMEEWHVKFDHIDEEWENLLALFDWCANHERYESIKAFWLSEEPGSVVDFTTIYGYWDDRLNWLSWLMNNAGARGEWSTMLDALSSYAYTLTIMGRFEEAEALFKQGHTLLVHGDPQIETRFLLNHGNLCVFMNAFEEAHRLFDRASAVVQGVAEPLRTRLTLNIEYNRSGNYYWEKNYVASRRGFSMVINKARDYHWYRYANYAQNYLADIAINEGKYEEAGQLLESGIIMAERNHEKRRTLNYRRSFAHFYHKQGKFQEALEFARKAREGYILLDAKQDIRKMDELIKELQMSTSTR